MTGANETARGLSMFLAAHKRVTDAYDAMAIDAMMETIDRAYVTACKADEGACTIAVDPAAPGADHWSRAYWDGKRVVTEGIARERIYKTGSYGESTLPAELQKKIDEDLAWSMRSTDLRPRRIVVDKRRSLGRSPTATAAMAAGFYAPAQSEPVPPGRRNKTYYAVKQALGA